MPGVFFAINRLMLPNGDHIAAGAKLDENQVKIISETKLERLAKIGAVRKVKSEIVQVIEAARAKGVEIPFPEDEDADETTPEPLKAETEVKNLLAEPSVETVGKKSQPKQLWDADPESLKGKTLEQLNHMIADRDPKKKKAAKTVEAAIKTLTADRPKEAPKPDTPATVLPPPAPPAPPVPPTPPPA